MHHVRFYHFFFQYISYLSIKTFELLDHIGKESN